MKKEDLYRAIGGINSRYITDVPGKLYSEMNSSRPLTDERTIVMDVVKQKKIRLRIFAVAAAVLVAAGAAAAALLGPKKDKKEYKEKKIENYFREDENFSDYNLPNGFSNIDNIISVDDGTYFTAYFSDNGADDRNYIYNSENDVLRYTDEIHGAVYKIYSGEKYLWIASENDDGTAELLRADPSGLQITDRKMLNEGEVISQIYGNEDGTADIEMFRMDSERNITDWIFCTIDDSMNETDRVCISGKSFPEDSQLCSCIRDNETGEYYMFFRDSDQNTSMYRYSPDGTEIYNKVNIAADMDGTVSGYFFSRSGNPVIMAHSWGSDISGENQIQFNEFDSESGEICGMYEADLNGSFPYIGTSSWNFSDKYDFLYSVENKIYGFNLENESSELVYEMKSNNSVVISSGNGPLMLYGTETGAEQNGYYIFKTDNSGNIESRSRLGTSSILKMRKSSDNTVYVLAAEHESEYREDILTDRWYISDIDSDCGLTKKVYIDIDNESMPWFQNFIINDDTVIIPVEYTEEGHGYYEIMYFDMEGNRKGVSDCRNMTVSAFFESEGNVYALMSNDEKSSVSKINPENKELEEVTLLQFDAYSTDLFSEGNDEYDLFINFNDGIYGYRLSDNSLSEIVNWMDSDIYFSQINSFDIQNSNRISIGCFDDSENVNEKLCSFTRVDDETLKSIQNRKVINAAFFFRPGEDTIRFFREYNASSAEYRVHVDDFTKYTSADNIPDISSHLDSEIIRGNIPDMIFAATRFDWLKYASDGMFENIEKLSENDEEFERADYFENIFDAYKYDGIQFAVPVNFDIRCMTAKKSVTGDNSGFTCSELEEMEDNGNLFSDTSYRSLTDKFILSDITEYADFKSGKCDFDNQNFISLLNIIKRNSDPDQTYTDFSVLESAVPENRKIFNLFSVTGFSGAARAQQIYTGEEMSFIGYPSPAESLPLVSSDCCIGITADSSVRDGAWEIIKILLSDEMQETTYDSMFGDYHFPVSRSVFNQNYEKAMKNGSMTFWSSLKGKEVRIRAVDQLAVDNIRSTVSKIKKAALYDSRIAEIIDEEVYCFINDGKTAEETAGSIQSKVSLYLKEIK